MSVDVQAEVIIQRPRTEVAAFMFDPRNDHLWTTGVVEVKPHQDGLLRTGAKVERVSKFLGRKFGYLIEVVDHGDEQFVEMKATQPFEMRVRYELESQGDHTVTRIHTTGGGTGFFRIAAGLMGRMVRRSIQNDLENLKEYLDAGGDRSDAG